MSQVIIAEKNQIKPKQRKALESAGYIVVVVADVEKVKLLEPDHAGADDGFKLDHASQTYQ